jgi:ERCC4 domain
VEELRRLHVETSICRLEYGDCVFTGNGPDGECMVGVERKRLADLVTSMQDRRLSGHQLRGLWQAVDFVYLVAEGVWREGDGGQIEEWGWVAREKRQGWRAFYSGPGGGSGRSAISFEQLDHYLCTLELKGGVVLRRTRDARETARFYVSRWRWFNQKAWDAHKSADQVYCGGVVKKGHGGEWAVPHGHDPKFAPGRRAGMKQTNPTTLLRAAMQLPGVDARAAAVTEHFGSVRRMALAGLRADLLVEVEAWLDGHPAAVAAAWKALDGFGDKRAAAVVRAIAEKGA